MQVTILPLHTWFLAFYLIGQALALRLSLSVKLVFLHKELRRHLALNYDTAYLLRRKIKWMILNPVYFCGQGRWGIIEQDPDGLARHCFNRGSRWL